MAPNEAFGWISILAGFTSGMLLGLRFHDERFLGGYTSLPRRMVRLGHVALVALGVLNLEFARSAPGLRLGEGWTGLASWAMIAGGATMPLCCGLMAWKRGFQPLFAVPVVSLIGGATIVVVGLVGR